jgi:micrococcal nuclease
VTRGAATAVTSRRDGSSATARVPLRGSAPLVALALALALGGAPWAARGQALPLSGTVTRVIDGDTIEVEGAGRVRLIGVDAPELGDRRPQVADFARRARDYATLALLGEVVRLEPGAQPLDRYGRALAYVHLADGTLFNGAIIRDGYAFVYARFPFERLEEFRRYERQARDAGRGLWAEGAAEAPRPSPPGGPELRAPAESSRATRSP